MNFFIRFGVHKDREVIKELRELLSGIFIPAHILSYSPNPTIAAVDYINKPYYIDPMTYVYAVDNIADYLVSDKKTGGRKFKPSISKLTDDYDLAGHFAASNYAALTPADFTDTFVDALCQKNVDLQLQKIDNEKGRAYKRYKDLLSKVGEESLVKKLNEIHKPAAIIPPYFYFENLSNGWLAVNKKLLAVTKTKTNEPVIPIILANSQCLTEDLLKAYTGCEKIFIWVDDLNEKDTNLTIAGQVAKLKKLVSFVKIAKSKGIEITNLYGSYFSLLLGKLGMAGVCNGVFYGETKSRISKIGGGPPSRYYIRGVHDFFAIPTAITLLKNQRYVGLLDTACKKCMSLINNNPDNIIVFAADHSKAQRHFVYAREMELSVIEQTSLADLVKDLNDTYKRYNPLDTSIVKKSIDYLDAWRQALEPEV
jgi:hypothetical protein